MSELEDRLNAVLNDPNAMQQIMSIAQALGTGQQAPEPEKPVMPDGGIDPAILRSLAGMAQRSGVDQNQQTLLNALSPYLSQGRVHKLEKAMRAAKMAGMATSFLNAGGLKMLSGR